MKFLFLCLFFSVSFNAMSANSGDEVRNGGGIAEQYLTYALKTLPRSIDLCLQRQCVKDQKQKDLLLKIQNSIPLELQTEVLQFTSNQRRPGLFIINGVERLAVTADYVGAPIYYNVGMLYNNGIPLTLGGAIQSLVHELGHHQGVEDHDSLEVLGSEVRKNFESFVMETPYHFQGPGRMYKNMELKAISIRSGSTLNNASGSLELIFTDDTVNISSLFESLKLKCDSNASKPIISSSLQFFNLHWKYQANELDSSEKYLSGNVMIYCRDIYSRSHKKNYEFNLKVKTVYTNKFTYLSSELIKEPTFIYTEHIKLPRNLKNK